MAAFDPTKTATLRRRYAQAMNRRFRRLAKDVRTSLVTNDALGLRTNAPAPPQAFDFPTSAEKSAAFRRWLRREIDRGILEVVLRNGQEVTVHRAWQDIFIRSAYIRGVTGAETDLSNANRLVAPLDIELGPQAGIHAETLQLMYSRVFEGLRGITESMSGQLSEILTQGLIEGVGPRTIAKRITDQIGSISRTRAMVLARTETIRTLAEARLNTFEQNGVSEVEGEVEILTAQDDRVCSRCLALVGKTFKISEARGVIPLHPRCRCNWRFVISEEDLLAA